MFSGPSGPAHTAGLCGAGGSDRLLSRKEPIDPLRNILQIGLVAAPDLRRDVAAVLDLGQRAPHFRPVDIPFADVLPREAPVRPIEAEVLEVDLDDARAERPNPVLRERPDQDVSNVEIR